MFGLGGELAKEVAFTFMFCYYFVQACDVQWLVGFPFYKAVIPYNLLFQNLDPFCNQNFLWFCLICKLENLNFVQFY